jgi:hypothetical protein
VTVWTDEMKSAAMQDAATVCKQADRIAELEAALRAVVRDVNDYERVNNLAPNPGRAECWDSVARAKAVLAKSI